MGNKTSQPEEKVYRIPALLYVKESRTLLAFAERRRSKDDASAEMLVMKTGILRDESTEVIIEWSELKEVPEAHLPGHRPMNPCPVYEKTSKSLFLFFICVEGTVSECWQRFTACNKARLCYITSQDDGQTWSHVTDLTDNLRDVIKDWTTFAVGPGHGIQTESGRLIIPTYAYCPAVPGCSIPYALSVYSDDLGKTWQIGKMLQMLKSTWSLECEMVEVIDDAGQSSVYCNARSNVSYRVEAVSKNGGCDFTTLPPGSKLVETGNAFCKQGGCQGSVIGFPSQTESKHTGGGPSQKPPTWLLYTHPTSKTNRVDLGVYVNRSPLEPSAWSAPWIINSGPSAYSDLAFLSGDWFACLMERGEQSETEQIASVVFTYDDIKQGAEKKKYIVFP